MTPQTDSPIADRFRTAARAAALIVAAVGILVLIGWALDIPVLKSILPGWVSMKANTALGFVLAGAALWLLVGSHSKSALLPAAAVALIGLLTIGEYGFGVDFGIDQFLFKDNTAAVATSNPGRMAIGTAVCFFFAGLAMILIDSAAFVMAQMMAFVVLGFAVINLTGYAYGIESFYSISNFTKMAFHTAFMFAFLSTGTLMSRPERGFMSILASDTIGGVIARRFLPVCVVVPFILGWLRLKGQDLGYFELRFGLGLMTMATIFSLVAAVWLMARLLARADILRRQNEEAIRQRTAELERLNQAIEKAVAIAEEATRAKSRFLASMSHELRTPLNAILGYSEILMEEAEERGQKESRSDLQKIHGAGKHLLALINDILDISKVEAGKMQFHIETFDVAAALRDIAETARPLAGKNGNTLEARIPDHLGAMRSDVVRVRQCLFNLLSNACKFTEKGTVTLEAARAGDFLEFRVRDTGIGIPADKMGELFQTFTQIESRLSRKQGGTGLGLALTRQFCRALGGDVTAESVSGKGSTFTLRLPAMAVVGQAPAESASPSPAGTALTTVLVIDDVSESRELVKRQIQQEGFHVVTAGSADEGVKLAREIKPDVITLDVLMPVKDGWAALKELKDDPSTADIPVVMLTIIDHQKELGFSLGAADYLVKPVTRERLVSVLDKHRCAAPPCDVLIVEDEPQTREMLRRMIGGVWTASEASNGREALARLDKSGRLPCLILLDLLMPVMDGFEFLDELRKNSAWRDIPVIVITSKDLTEPERRALNDHAQRIMQKGAYTKDDLMAEIKRVIGKR